MKILKTILDFALIMTELLIRSCFEYFKDLLAVIAYGSSEARAVGAFQLLCYYPEIHPTPNDARLNLAQRSGLISYTLDCFHL